MNNNITPYKQIFKDKKDDDCGCSTTIKSFNQRTICSDTILTNPNAGNAKIICNNITDCSNIPDCIKNLNECTVKTNTYISLDNSNIENYNFNRISPNFMRFYDIYRKDGTLTGFNSYEEEILYNGGDIELCGLANCLRQQLMSGEVKYFNLRTLTYIMLPSIYDTKVEIEIKNNLRNQFIFFCLEIEKSYLFYSKGLNSNSRYSNNWTSYFNVYYDFTDNKYKATIFNKNNFTIYQAINLYTSSIRFKIFFRNLVFDNRVRNVFFSNNRCVSDIPSKKELFNKIDIFKRDDVLLFVEIVQYGLSLLTNIYSISAEIKANKNPGLPCNWQKNFFSYKQSIKYVEEYYNVILTRNNYWSSS